MRTFVTFSFTLLAAATALAQSPRPGIPTGSSSGSIPTLRVPSIFIPEQETTAATPDYDRIIKTGDYLFDRQRYPEAIAEYEKALGVRPEQYPKDQIMRSKALEARVEKERVLQAEEERRQNIHRIPPGQFLEHALSQSHKGTTALVCDVTGSMGKHDDQVMKWLKGLLEGGDTTVQRVVLFNDNDNRKKQIKDPLVATGLYSFRPISYEQTLEQMKMAKKEASGGDVQENNITALLLAQLDCPSADRLLMICDNNQPWDISEAPKVTKPVDIIVCDAAGRLEVGYLNLARSTKGTVWYNGRSYTDLDSYTEGMILKVDFASYVLRNGVFMPIG